MENISYSVKTIRLLPSYIRDPIIVRQLCKNEQLPLDRICFEVKETHHCPFCRKGATNFHCECEEFLDKFKKLQESVHDEKHETMAHVRPYENLCGQINSISISSEKLTSQEIANLGPNIWDDARKILDNENDHSFFLADLTYKEGILDFICKDLQSKDVYRCSIKGIDYNNHKIYLGSIHKRVVYRRGEDRSIGNSHLESYWKDIAEFDDWNSFCEKIQSV